MRTSTIITLAAITLAPSLALADETKTTTTTETKVVDPKAKADVDETAVAPEGGYVVPKSVPYRGGKIPDYAHIETKPNVGLIATGLATFGTAYLGAFIYALATCSAQMDCRAGSNWLYLPIAGPFIAAATSPTTGGAALAAFDGGVQVLGTVLAVTGFLAPKKYVMWQDKTARVEVKPGIANAPAFAGGGPQLPAVGGGVSITLTHL